MSYQVFVLDIKKEPLTIARLQHIWEFTNIKNKSSLIDTLTKSLYNAISKRSEIEGIPPEQVSIPVDDVCKMCDKFYDIMIKNIIKPTIPLIEPLPVTVHTIDTTWKYNPPTGIVFRPDEQYQWVAIRVMKSNRIYPLTLSHLNICISNGWYFETTMSHITSPYRVN